MASIIWLARDPGWEQVVAGLSALLILLGTFVTDRPRVAKSDQTDQLEAEFEAIWPSFFETLEDDLRRIEASADLARIRSWDPEPHPGIEIHSPLVATKFTVYHQRTISNHDDELGELLKNFLGASDRLRLSANAYNRFIYADLREGPDFKKPESLKSIFNYRFVRDDMYEKSRALEDAIDNLNLKLRYYGDLQPS